jgi:hypothetical protein
MRGQRTALAMNAPLLPEVLVRRSASSQADLPLAAEGVLRYLWEGRFGPMLIEVRDGQAFVNGQAVERAEPNDESDGLALQRASVSI